MTGKTSEMEKKVISVYRFLVHMLTCGLPLVTGLILLQQKLSQQAPSTSSPVIYSHLDMSKINM